MAAVEPRVKEMFQRFDSDVNGFLDSGEMARLQEATQGTKPQQFDEVWKFICDVVAADPARGLTVEDLNRWYCDAGGIPCSSG